MADVLALRTEVELWKRGMGDSFPRDSLCLRLLEALEAASAQRRAGLPEMSRVWAMPNADTFSVPPIRNFVTKYLSVAHNRACVSVDPFARNSKLAQITNDLNPQTTAAHHMDAEDFLLDLAGAGVQAGVIILDPPYSPRQISECYAAAGKTVGMKDTQNAALYSRVRSAARRICKAGTIVLSFGWNSAGMGDGFEPVELLLVAHGGAHNDTICLAEQMVQPNLI